MCIIKAANVTDSMVKEQLKKLQAIVHFMTLSTCQNRGFKAKLLSCKQKTNFRHSDFSLAQKDKCMAILGIWNGHYPNFVYLSVDVLVSEDSIKENETEVWVLLAVIYLCVVTQSAIQEPFCIQNGSDFSSITSQLCKIRNILKLSVPHLPHV